MFRLAARSSKRSSQPMFVMPASVVHHQLGTAHAFCVHCERWKEVFDVPAGIGQLTLVDCWYPPPPRQPQDQNWFQLPSAGNYGLESRADEAARGAQLFSGCRALKTSCVFFVLLLVLQNSNLAGAKLEAQFRPQTPNHTAQNRPQTPKLLKLCPGSSCERPHSRPQKKHN